MKRKGKLVQFVFCLFVIVPAMWATAGAGAILDVPSDYPNIQAAIDGANSGDTVRVADGTYSGPGNVNLIVLGRAINIISQNGANNCVIDCQGSGRAFTFTGVETTGSVLRGFTITGGNEGVVLNLNTHEGYGGAILCLNDSSPTIADCIITGNAAKYGGGIACYNNSSPIVENCVIEENNSGLGGGGLYCYGSSPTIIACTITKNIGGYLGGGACVNSKSSPTILSSMITGNSATKLGGGIYCSLESSPLITNCTVADNLAGPSNSMGGGIYIFYNSKPVITNAIFWNNSATVGLEVYMNSNCTLRASYSNIKGGKAGVYTNGSALDWLDETNKELEPGFVGEGDYHLIPGSPCVDSGTLDVELPETDFEGDPRVLSSSSDIGADEVRTEYVVEIDIKPGSHLNKIDLRARGVLPVAVLSAEDFDARMIHPETVIFAGAEPVHWVLKDLNRDHRLDMLLFFRLRDLDLDENSTEATLMGEATLAGEVTLAANSSMKGSIEITGTDSVTIVKHKGKGWYWAKLREMIRNRIHHHSYHK